MGKRTASRRKAGANSGRFTVEPGTIPAPIVERVREVQRHLEGRAVFVCSHARSTGHLPIVCSQHPAIGLLCSECFMAHAARHDELEEQTCDSCRQPVDLISGVAVGLFARGATVRTVAGKKAIMFGPAMLAGLGICDECLRRAA